MKIHLHEIPIREVFAGYQNDDEEGVVGYGGRLNIRPKYQREFIYKDKERDAVITTVRKDFPLNVLYWAKSGADSFEVLDGQQRTISICQYLAGDFSLNYQYFFNLEEAEKEQILNYKLTVYFCEGDDREKLDWFKTINIAGIKLADQELRNAVYTGSWLTDAKRHFSKTGCAAYGLAVGYVSGSPIRQDYLETAIDWVNDGEIEEYMAKHQHDKDAYDLWTYFQRVINWTKSTFPIYRKEMKSVNWGSLYNRFNIQSFDPVALERMVVELMQDDDVTKRSGIYAYLLTGEEKHLSIRAFSDNMKRAAYEHQAGVCPVCGKHFEISEMEADHITPWSKGGKTTSENCQMLCKEDNRRKSGV